MSSALKLHKNPTPKLSAVTSGVKGKRWLWPNLRTVVNLTCGSASVACIAYRVSTKTALSVHIPLRIISLLCLHPSQKKPIDRPVFHLALDYIALSFMYKFGVLHGAIISVSVDLIREAINGYTSLHPKARPLDWLEIQAGGRKDPTDLETAYQILGIDSQFDKSDIALINRRTSSRGELYKVWKDGSTREATKAIYQRMLDEISIAQQTILTHLAQQS